MISLDKDGIAVKTRDEYIYSIMRKIAQLEDNRLTNAIIGSKILGFRLEKIPNWKTLYYLYLKTDAPIVPLIEPLVEGKTLKLIESKRAYQDPSEIKLKVKLS